MCGCLEVFSGLKFLHIVFLARAGLLELFQQLLSWCLASQFDVYITERKDHSHFKSTGACRRRVGQRKCQSQTIVDLQYHNYNNLRLDGEGVRYNGIMVILGICAAIYHGYSVIFSGSVSPTVIDDYKVVGSTIIIMCKDALLGIRSLTIHLQHPEQWPSLAGLEVTNCACQQIYKQFCL